MSPVVSGGDTCETLQCPCRRRLGASRRRHAPMSPTCNATRAPTDTCETPGVRAWSRGSRKGARVSSHWCPDCASSETPPGSPTQTCPPRALCATPGRHCWSAPEILCGHARDSERPSIISRCLMRVPVAAPACSGGSPQRREEALIHGAARPDRPLAEAIRRVR